MKKDDEEISAGLNEIFEIINAKGDTGELRKIVDNYEDEKKERQKDLDHI